MVTSLLKATALRSKYLTPAAYSKVITANRTAAVVGATSGIGQACAHRLAEQGYTVLAIGRDRAGRAEAIVEELTAKSKKGLNSEDPSQIPKHEFYPCDAFSLKDVNQTAQKIMKDHPTVDVVVLTQGMATSQGFTPTKEGNDEKLTLHYYSRVAMANALLPALRSSTMQNGPVVLTVLSGGAHSAYAKFKEDVTLEKNYSISNAANAAGFYTDLGFDKMALDDKNRNINFVHASPGFVNTNWGTEFNTLLRCMVRMMQPLGRKASDCAEYMLSPTVFASEAGEALVERLNGNAEGLYVMGENGQTKGLTKEHTNDARDFVWNHTVQVLKKAGIEDMH